MKAYFTPAAEELVDEIDFWWRANRPKSPGLFASELAEARAFIMGAPKLGRIYVRFDGQDVRRIVFRKTGHHLYYTERPDPRGAGKIRRIAI